MHFGRVPLDAFHDGGNTRLFNGRTLAIIYRNCPGFGSRADTGEDRYPDPVKVGDIGNPGHTGGRYFGFDPLERLCEG